MKELRSVKFEVGMYDDIKLKIIDTMERRDLIHYCLARFIVLAGKINIDGYLFINENMPYTIYTLAIEFNRTIEEIELSVKVLIDLEILELTKQKIYKVKNWAKHQNIKKKCDEHLYIDIEDDKNSCKIEEIKGTNIIEPNVENISEDVENITEEVISQTVNSNNNLEESNKKLMKSRVLECKNTDINKKLVKTNSLKDENKTENIVIKENNDDLRDKIIFELKTEDNKSKVDEEKEGITSTKLSSTVLLDKTNKMETKKKSGRRGRSKKSSNGNLKTRNLKKDNSLIQFSSDEYENDDFTMKEDNFVTFVME